MRYQQDFWARYRHLIKIKHFKLLGPQDAQAQNLSIDRYMDSITFELKTNFNFTVG